MVFAYVRACDVSVTFNLKSFNMTKGETILLPWLFIKFLFALFTAKYLTNMEALGVCVAGTCVRRENADYFVSNSTSFWNEAQDICSAMGGNLLDISSNADKDFLNKTVKFNNRKMFWIGLRKNHTKPATQVRENDNDILIIDDGCLKAQWNRSTSSITYTKIPCSRTFKSICMKGADDLNNCKGWTGNVSGRTNCFLPVYHRMTWFGALAHCKALNGSILTREVLKNLTTESDSILKQQFWIQRSPRLRMNPNATWKNTLDEKVFEYRADFNIRIKSVGCRGCSFWNSSRVFLDADCERSLLAICNSDLSDYENFSEVVNRSFTWFRANNTCHSLELNTSLPLPENMKKFEKNLKNVAVWLGLQKNVLNDTPCAQIEKEDESKFTDFTLDKCYSVNCRNFTEKRESTTCNGWEHPLCVRKKLNLSDNCKKPWNHSQDFCYLFLSNLKTSWIAAHVFCLEHGGRLANNTELATNQISLGGSNVKRCWLATREVFTPLDPLHGWRWINGLSFDYKTKLSRGIFRHTGGIVPRCAALLNKNTWKPLHCNEANLFICKINKTGVYHQNYIDLCKRTRNNPNKTDVTREEDGSSEKKAEFIKEFEAFEEVISGLRSDDGSVAGENGSYNTEEALSDFENAVLGVINQTSFNASFSIKTEKFELDVFTTTLDDLVNGTTNISYPIPLDTIRELCENAACTVKGVKITINSVSLNVRSIRKSPLLTTADILALNYLVEGKQVNQLQENETLSLMFQRKEHINKPEFHCVYLDGQKWSEKGLETASFTKETVQCITNHLTSFSLVVLDAELDEDNKSTEVLKYIIYIGTALSLTALVVTLFAYIYLHKDLQVLSNSEQLVHLNLLISLGGTQIVFLAGGNESGKEVFCKIVAVLLHYFSLASLCWMLLEATLLYLKIISVFSGENVQMNRFFAFGWGFPSVFVFVSAGAGIDNYGNNKWCWLSYEGGYFWVFFAPVIVILALNLIAIVAVVCVVCQATRKYEQNKRNRIYAAIRGVAILFPTLGLSWIFGVIAVNHDAIVWKYLFGIFNSMQGFLIFLIYGVCNVEIRSAFKRRLGREVHHFSSSSHSQK